MTVIVLWFCRCGFDPSGAVKSVVGAPVSVEWRLLESVSNFLYIDGQVQSRSVLDRKSVVLGEGVKVS